MLKFLYCLTLASLALGQLGALNKSDGANVYLFDLVISVFAVLGVAEYLVRKKLFIPRYLLLMFPFILLGVASLIGYKHNLAADQFVTSLFYSVRLFLYVLAGVVFYNLKRDGILSNNFIDNSIYLFMTVVGVGGFIQLVILPDFRVLNSELGWDPHQYRLASTFFDPNFVGAFFNIGIALLLDHIFKSRKNPWLYYLFVFLSVCTFLTFSRSAWAMYGVLIFLYGLFRDRKMLLVSFIIIFLAYFAVPRVQTRLSGITDPSDSARFRLESWSNALTLSKNNLLTGVGFNAYKYAQLEAGMLNGDTFFEHSATGSDSSFIFVLVTTGVLGLLIFLVWWFYPVVRGLAHKEHFDFLLFSMLLGLTLESQFINSIFYPQILFMIILLMARGSPSDSSQ